MAKVTMSVSQLRRSLRTIALFASTDETRPNLNAVLFAPVRSERGAASASPAGLRMVATDGHRMGVVDVIPGAADGRDLSGAAWDDGEEEVLFPLPAILATLATLPKGAGVKVGGVATIDTVTGAVVIDGATVATWKPSDANFPAYHHDVMAKGPGTGAPGISVNAEYLADICEAVKLAWDGGAASPLAKPGKPPRIPSGRGKTDPAPMPILDCETWGPFDPIRFTCAPLGLTMILMPARSDLADRVEAERKAAARAEKKSA